MMIIEFKDGPNKGKQVVFPTPDHSKPAPEIETISTNADGPDLDYFKDLLIENSRVPSDRFDTAPVRGDGIWKKFLRLFRRSE